MKYIPVSYGEMIDKYTILLIKERKISDINKLLNIRKELLFIVTIINEELLFNILSDEIEKLKQINETLWEIEDMLREKESNKEFDNEFIELARSVYKTNDNRFEIKNKINNKTNSDIKEEKSYKKYQ